MSAWNSGKNVSRIPPLNGNDDSVGEKRISSVCQSLSPVEAIRRGVMSFKKCLNPSEARFTCCGVINSSDWLTPLNTNESRGVPMSCCSHVYGSIATFVCNTTSAYSTGCSQAFGNWVQDHAGAIGISGIFLVLMQALAVAGALWLANIARKEREFP